MSEAAMTTDSIPSPTNAGQKSATYRSPFSNDVPTADPSTVPKGAGEAVGRPENLNVPKQHIAAEIAKNKAIAQAENGDNPFVN